MNQTPSKLLHAIALISVLAVCVALVSQHVFGMRPCAWSVMQRLLYLLIAICCWLGLLLRRWRPAETLATVAAAALGICGVMSAWYQYSVASNMFSCDRTFADKFMVGLGLDAHLPWLFGIFASCADARVKVLGVEYAIWSLILFALLTLAALSALARPRRA